METLYQKKFNAFKSSFNFTAEDLKTKFNSNAFADGLGDLQNSIKNLLEKSNKASENFKSSMERTPNAIADFCQFVCDDNPRFWENNKWDKLADFIKRLAVDAPTPSNDNRITPVFALKEIIGELMKNLNCFSSKQNFQFSPEKNNSDVKIHLKNFFSSYQLFDRDGNNHDIKLLEGIHDYFREMLNDLSPESIKPENDTTDPHTYVINSLHTIFADGITEESAIKILMDAAPDSIWEMKCIQAGICNLEWVEVKK